MLRRLLHLYWRFSRGMTLGVRAVVIDGDKRVLLVRHGYTPGWHLPGGGVEPGETLLDALTRELAEEANVIVAGPPALHGVFFNRAATQRDHVALFIVHDFAQGTAPEPSYEIQEARFFPIAELPADTTAATRRRLDEIVSGRAPAADW
jgi:ADP-ribose pyrophosphatase YjhB (NUDIX family)